MAAPMIAAVRAATVSPVPHGVDSSVTGLTPIPGSARRSRTTRPGPFVKRQGGRRRDIERIRAACHRDAHPRIAEPHRSLGQPRALGADQYRHLLVGQVVHRLGEGLGGRVRRHG